MNEIGHRLQRQQVALGAEAADDARGDLRDIGLVAKRLSPVNVGQMHLNDRQLGERQRIEEGDRGMAVGGRIDDDAGLGAAGFLDPGNQFTLDIRLAEIDGKSQRLALGGAGLADISQGVAPIHLGLAYPQHVEIGPVEDEDALCLGQDGWIPACREAALFGAFGYDFKPL